MFNYHPSPNFQPLFVFTADNHIKRRIWKNIPEIEFDTYNSLTQICDFCDEHKLPLLVGGDLFDSRTPTASDVNFVRDKFSRMHKDVFCLDGNHDGYNHIDSSERGTWIEAVDAICINGKKFDLEGVTVYGQPYALPKKLEEDLSSLDSDIDVLVCHQLLHEIVGSTIISNMQASWVPNSIKTILMGDYHKQTSFSNLDDQFFIYPGSTAPMRFSELDEKYFLVIGKKGDLITYEMVPLVTRTLLTYAVADKPQLDSVIKTIKRFVKGEDERHRNNKYYEAVRKPYVRLTYDSSLEGVPVAVSRILDMVYVESEPIGSNALRIDSTKLEEASISVQQVMDRLVDKKENPELYSFGLDLASSDDYTAVFNSKREELGVKEINED